MHWMGFCLDCRDEEDLWRDHPFETAQMQTDGSTFGLLRSCRLAFPIRTTLDVWRADRNSLWERS